MDVDPLADIVPPRHAIESDEEEDEYNPLPIAGSYVRDRVTDVKFIADAIPKGKNLVVVTGDIAKYWACGANLGEQNGGVYLNKVQVGLFFNPDWTSSTIIVSEVLTRLPVWAMHQYVFAILDALKPAKVALLDAYPAPAYISERRILFEDAPLRYLAIQAVDETLLKLKAQPFAPPNLIQSTSASFLSVLSVSPSQIPGTLILVPSPHIPSSAPKVLQSSNFSHFDEDPVEWPQATINLAQELLFGTIGENVPRWVRQGTTHNKASSVKNKGDVGEGGMYI
ncbi:hypothetical protein H0H87_003098 [Tephrocybe sp. NHM501043]|nr:hypothetical protein H0H87_003098 [Tephrocybe sp. NHM501043]